MDVTTPRSPNLISRYGSHPLDQREMSTREYRNMVSHLEQDLAEFNIQTNGSLYRCSKGWMSSLAATLREALFLVEQTPRSTFKIDIKRHPVGISQLTLSPFGPEEFCNEIDWLSRWFSSSTLGRCLLTGGPGYQIQLTDQIMSSPFSREGFAIELVLSYEAMGSRLYPGPAPTAEIPQLADQRDQES
ncbi:hypothetical protein QCN27_19700 [Cereibacter sp. SYSU M97828]|nr:hypothetical protein [Cereibacter flavus]